MSASLKIAVCDLSFAASEAAPLGSIHPFWQRAVEAVLAEHKVGKSKQVIA